MRLRLRLGSAIIGASALLVPLLGVIGAQATAASTSPPPPTCVVKASPYSFVETGLGESASSVAFIITVECKPVYSEQTVSISSSQLNNACHNTLSWYSATATAGTGPGEGSGESFNVVLDNDGNATAVVWGGPSCAASRDLIEADLQTAPFTTVTTHVVVSPPETTKEGLHVYPVSEVEDANTSSVAAIFYLEFPSVYAERTVEISDGQLSSRCQVTWVGPDEVVLGTGSSVTTTLDDNGNAFVVALAGPSCPSGKTLATADLVGPPYTTLTAGFTILSPRVTV